MLYSNKNGIEYIRLGNYIKRSTRNNSQLEYGTELIAGVSNEGVFTTPKGDVTGVNLKPYKIVNNGAFVYNPSRLDLGSIAYRTAGLCIVSHLYQIFYLNAEGKKRIDPVYLYMYLRRKEFYREVNFRNFGSQRPEFNFNDMSEIIMPLPTIEVQKKYADIYRGMVENQQSYESGVEDLKIVFQGYIDKLRRELEHKRIKEYIELSDSKNDDLQYGIQDVRGISNDKKFIFTKADMEGVSLKPYSVVHPDEFAYVTVTSRNGEKISLARNCSTDSYICSSSYTAYGIFLCYSIGLDKDKYDNATYKRLVESKMVNDLKYVLPKIQKGIADCGLTSRSVYVYIVPLDNATEDKTSIMNKIVGGGH